MGSLFWVIIAGVLVLATIVAYRIHDYRAWKRREKVLREHEAYEDFVRELEIEYQRSLHRRST